MSNALEELQRLRNSNEELLAALKGLEYKGVSEPGRFCDHPDYPNDQCPRCLAANIAIAKAEGVSTKRKGFTSGERMIATDYDCNEAKWSGREPGNFWCQTCGHRFAVGDGYRWIYANGHSPSAGNFMVCDNCDAGNDKMIQLRQEAIKLLSVVPDEYDAAMIVAYQLAVMKR